MISVYLVEDDKPILEELANDIPWLENGFQVVGAESDPLGAVEEIARLQPQVVFTDMQMAGMDGLALMEAVMQGPAQPRFVMVSAFASFELSRRFFLANGFDFVRKPMQLADVQIVLERLYGALVPQAKPSGAPLSPAFSQLVDYVTAHFQEKFSLTQLARQFGLSENYICNLFAKHFNSTLTKFVTRLRMEEAARLIASSSLPIKEIAVQCGYGDYFYFNKVFKTTYGISPGMYGRQARGKAEGGMGDGR